MDELYVPEFSEEVGYILAMVKTYEIMALRRFGLRFRVDFSRIDAYASD